MEADMSDTIWHGFRKAAGGPALHIGPIPGRKQIALTIVENNRTTAEAYFSSEYGALETLHLLDSLLNPVEVRTP
jgi:hypothetical protein